MLVVIGSTGHTGQLAVRQALAAGYKVRAFCRDGEKATRLLGEHANLTLAIGDVQAPGTVDAGVS